MLTHGNFMFELGVAVDELDELFATRRRGSTLLFLPLAHVFARVIQVGAVQAAGPARATPPTSRAWSTTSASSGRPSCWPCPGSSRRSSTPPASEAAADGRGRIFDRAAEVAIAYSRALDARPVRAGCCAPQHALFDRLVYARLRERARRPLRGTPSPAAHRSASGSATSTAASG